MNCASCALLILSRIEYSSKIHDLVHATSSQEGHRLLPMLRRANDALVSIMGDSSS